MVKRYPTELLVAALSLAVIVSFVAMQHVVLNEPAKEAGATATRYVGLVGAPLDDTYIHCRFAQNLLRGNGYGFNPDQSVTADTSPLWVGLLAVAGLVTSDLPLAAIVLSALFYVVLSIGVFRAARDVFELDSGYAALAGVLTALSSRTVWAGMSGMETALACLIMLLVVEEHERSRQRGRVRTREGLWLGLGILTRPEFLFVAVVLAIDWLVAWKRHTADIRAAFPTAALAVILASPTVILPLMIEGSLISHSSHVQGAGIHVLPNWGYLWFAAKILTSNNVVLALLLVATVGALMRDRRWRVALIIAIGLPIVQAFVAPQFRHHGRYFFPVIPLIVLLGMAGFRYLMSRLQQPRVWRAVITALVLIAGIAETTRWAMLEAESVRNINDQHLAAANFLRTSMLPTDRLAADDVGAIGYYTERPIVDLTGLVSPTLYPLQRDQHRVWTEARSEGANLFLIYDRLNPPFYSLHQDSLELIREFRIRKPLVSAADTVMSLYRVRHAD